MTDNTLVVNFYAGPGTGKSTTTALTFGRLKMAGRNVEIAHEYAKDLVWEGRTKALNFQPYIIGKQMYKVVRLFGEVEAILTDSPILLGDLYKTDDLPSSYSSFLFAMNDRWNTLNIVLDRDLGVRPYNPKGRTQTQDQAIALDERINRMLHQQGVPHHHVPIMDGDHTAAACYDLIMERL